MLFLPIQSLKAGMRLSSDVTAFSASNAFLLKKGTVLSSKQITGLRRFGIPGVYVSDGLSDDIAPAPPVLEPEQREKTIKDLEWVFNHSEGSSKARTVEYLNRIDKTVLDIVASIKKDDGRLVNISDLKSYDEYTYHHSLSVAILSIAIGAELGLSASELHKLGLSAILHDIGKMEIPISIINKQGKLTNEEFAVIKNHTRLSEKYLLNHNINDQEIFGGVMYHHEKLDGTGYPNGLSESKIPFYSKVISVADVYDALTSVRPYRKPMPPLEFTEYMMAGCGHLFDMDIVRAFLSKIEFFPVGSFVELSNGQRAIVVGHTNQLRPKVRLMKKPYPTIDLFLDVNSYGLTITKVFDKIPIAPVGG